MKYQKILTALFLSAAIPASFAAEITVSAAASLSDAFKDIAAQYEKQYPDAKVKLNTAASGVLLQQAAKGAPVDVLAFADQKTMDMAAQQDLIVPASHKNFALNTLVVVAPIDSKLSVKSLKDLQQPDIKRIASGNPDSVPAGRYAQNAMEKAGVWAQISPKIVRTQNVRQSLDYVARSEVEAGFVYNTDAKLQKDKVKVLWTVPLAQPVTYPIAVAKDSRSQVEAKRFADYVLSGKGQQVLQRYGFSKP
ncbi:MAG: molybdate ABC transporter substrate-binding protein [Neisseria sp.]|uniref:molybdate ABC transporter substrate-binding protein n=1 Tax=Neisseria sp. TaxID=192066 RepID=UPI0026DD513C|nr:molybdate ABC transporter substrate-binding protein [Neisseria sp.]MDO4640808.1 molybdate ABC transporter substrate-binding protein [Neisseria sp.]